MDIVQCAQRAAHLPVRSVHYHSRWTSSVGEYQVGQDHAQSRSEPSEQQLKRNSSTVQTTVQEPLDTVDAVLGKRSGRARSKAKRAKKI
jgi:hypothetical protein